MIGQSLSIALRALVTNKLRTALTMLGIIIGVGAVIALIAIGQGASAAVEASYTNLGTNVPTIVSGGQTVSGVRTATGWPPRSPSRMRRRSPIPWRRRRYWR